MSAWPWVIAMPEQLGAGTVTVGGAVVVGAVVAGSCRAGCVVVGADVETGFGRGATVVVDTTRPACQRQPLNLCEWLRCADATGIDIAATTNAAVSTTIAVRSLRLISTLCSMAGSAASKPLPLGRDVTAPGGHHAAIHGIRIGTGLEPPRRAGPERARSRDQPCECDVAVSSG